MTTPLGPRDPFDQHDGFDQHDEDPLAQQLRATLHREAAMVRPADDGYDRNRKKKHTSEHQSTAKKS